MLATVAATPVAVAGVGIGPLRRRISRALTRWACHKAAHIDVRDRQSAELLTEIGIDGSPVPITADFAHLLPNQDAGHMGIEASNVLARLREVREQGRLLIGLSLRPAVGNVARRSRLTAADAAQLDVMARAADTLVEQHDAEIVFVSMHPEQDDPIAGLLAERMLYEDRILLLSGKLPPKTIKALVGELDLMIGTRLHSLIFAACNQVPPIALAYDNKIRAYVESLGLGEQVVNPKDWQVAEITKAVQQTIDHASHVRAQLEKQVPGLVEAAAGSIDKICAVARGEC